MTLLAADVQAGEQPVTPAGDAKPDLSLTTPPGRPAEWTALPRAYLMPDLPATTPSSTGTFRPRGRSMLDKEAAFDGAADAPLVSDTPVWQRLSEYRVHDRVRVLTLWETGGNSVSLQADHRGEPTLQWTSRLAGRGSATHGVFDELFAKSLRAMQGRGSRDPLRLAPPDPGSAPDHPAAAVKGP